MAEPTKDHAQPDKSNGDQPGGRGNVGGGGGGGPDVLQTRVVTGPGTSGAVSNQPILPLDGNVFAGLSETQRDAVRKEQLTFAQGVSQLAATAYGNILNAVDSTTGSAPQEKT